MEKIAQDIMSRTGQDPAVLAREISVGLSAAQKAWLAGYFAGAADVNRRLAEAFSAGVPSDSSAAVMPAAVAAAASQGGGEVTILVASHSGNGKGFSKTVLAEAEKRGLKARVQNMASYKPRDLKAEKNILAIISTHGEGVPPVAAEELFEFLQGNRAPDLKGVNFSVLALGDRSYVHFCKAGIDLDALLEKCGAARISPRVDCDVDFTADAERWMNASLDALSVPAAPAAVSVVVSPSAAGKGDVILPSLGTSARNPFMADVLSKVNLNGRGSEKETYHIELSLEGSGLSYLPGDACGLVPRNSEALINELLAELHMNGSENTSSGQPLARVLRDYEISVLTSDVIKRHNSFARSKALTDILFDVARLKEFLYGRDFIDLLKEYPVTYTPDELLTVARPIPPRLYSIASSPLTYPGEVHLLVGVVRYNTFGRRKEGVASSFWADRILENEKVPVFIKPNEAFRLPKDGNVPMIMVGPGTGVAPFRAFIEERAARGDKGKSWLFFGNQHFTTDFLYQTEWQAHLASGILTRMDVAFSRDQEEKLYVQHKIIRNAKEVYHWIREGAVIYVCGDMKRMAQDVYHAFIDVIMHEGGLDREAVENEVKQLKRGGRYLEDVY